MAWKTLMVHLTLVHPNTEVLHAAAALAKRCDARVVGIAGCPPSPIIFTDGNQPMVFVEENRKAIDAELQTVRSEFEAVFPPSANAEWYLPTMSEPIAVYVARACCSADLVVTSGLTPERQEFTSDEAPGDIVMQAGRPVLVVPRAASALAFDTIVVAWRNTREARRAISDALPLLALATTVSVVEIAHDDQRDRVTKQLHDVVAWLRSHAIAATPVFVPSRGHDTEQLNAEALRLGADVVVAGAYGHSRMREWAFGGMTRSLMSQSAYCTLLSH